MKYVGTAPQTPEIPAPEFSPQIPASTTQVPISPVPEVLPEKAAGMPWATSLGVSGAAMGESLVNALYRMGSAASMQGKSFRPDQTQMQEFAAGMRPMQSTGQNVAAGVIGAAPYFLPGAGQALFAGDIVTQPGAIPEMVEGGAHHLSNIYKARYGNTPAPMAIADILSSGKSGMSHGDPQAQEEIRQQPVEHLMSAAITTGLGKGGLKLAGKGIGAVKGKFNKPVIPETPFKATPHDMARVTQPVGPHDIARVTSGVKPFRAEPLPELTKPSTRIDTKATQPIKPTKVKTDKPGDIINKPEKPILQKPLKGESKPKGKEPWEMRAEDAVDRTYPTGKNVPEAPEGAVANLNGQAARKKGFWEFKAAADGEWRSVTDPVTSKRLDHQVLTKQAIKEGKITSHPDYPELTPKPVPKTEPVGQLKPKPVPVNKKAGGKGSLIKEPKKAEAGKKVTASTSDINPDLAERAYRGTSFVSEKRGVQAQNEFVSIFNGVRERLEKHAKTERQKQLLEEELSRYKDNLKSKYETYLGSRQGMVSSMIAGPAKFPVRRMQKKSAAIDRKWDDVSALTEKAERSIRSKLNKQAVEDAGGPVEAMRKKLADAEATQETMKKANAILRKKKLTQDEKIATIVSETNISEPRAKALFDPDFGGNTGFARFELTNNLANIKRMRQRLTEMEGAEAKSGFDSITKRKGVEVINNFDAERVQIVFDGKPNDAIRTDLKGSGWRWSPREGAWQRKNTRDAQLSAERIVDKHFSTKPQSTTLGSGKVDAFRGKAEAPVSMLPKKGKPVSVEDVRNYFSRGIDVPVRTRKFRQKALGIYKGGPGVVRLKTWNDIPVLAHEIAHAIDQTGLHGTKGYPGVRQLRIRNRELTKLDYEYPKKARSSEGFAEYVRFWMTGAKDVKQLAPKFTERFNKFLKDNPDFKAYMEGGREIIQRWQEQGAAERIYNHIDMKGTSGRLPFGERVAFYKRKLQTLFSDDLAILEHAEKQLRGTKRLDPMKIKPSTSPTMIARAESKVAGAKARQMVLDGVFDYDGNRVAPSLRETLTPVNKDIKNFLTYAYAKRTLARMDIETGISKADAQFVVKTMETPAFKKAAEGLHNFQNKVLDYLVEAGGLDKDAAVVIREANPFYMPLKRAFAEGEGLTGTGGKRLANLGSPIKRLKGSGRMITNPLEAVIQSTTEIISIADKVRVGRALVNLAEKTTGGGKWVEKIPAPQEVRTFSLKRLEGELRQAGVELNEASLDQIITVYSNAPKYLGKDNVVSFWKNGKREFYEVDAELYSAMKGMDAPRLPWLLDTFMGKPARAVRLGATGVRAGFTMITNPIRDAFGFAMQTESGAATKTPYLLGKGLLRRFQPQNKYNELYKRSGVDMSMILGLDRKSLKNAVSEVLASDKKSKALNVVKHPIEAAKAVMSLSEAAPRMAEYEAVYKKGAKKWGEGKDARLMAANAASDVTVNFRRMGSVGATINGIIPFWNASMQGIGKFYRTSRRHPLRTPIRAFTGVTIPTVALWMRNKDEQWYKDMPPWLKYGFWHIEAGDTILRIPRPFEYGIVYGSLVEGALDSWYREDPDKIMGAFTQAYETTPFSPGNIMPAFAKPIIEDMANYDFFRERNIVPYWQEKNDPPEEQYGKYTAMTFREIGDKIGYSPSRLEHLAGGYSGGIVTDFIKSIEAIHGNKISEPADYPVVGRLFNRKQKSTTSTRATRERNTTTREKRER